MSPVQRIRGRIGASSTPIAPRAGAIGGLIALVAAAMGFLAAAAALTGVAADRIAGRWTDELSHVATVRVIAPEAELEAEVSNALSVLALAPGIADARVLSDEENRALLAPWLGPEADLAALPLPVLIDVQLEGSGPDAADVARQLSLAAPGAVWDDHGEWRAPLIVAARGVRRAAAAGVLMAVIALAAMVAVAAAATLWSGAGVVRTLRLIGAEDRFISRAFERPFALRAALGAGIGAAAAAIFAVTMPRIGVGAFGAGDFGGGAQIWLAPLAPPVAALIAGLTALGATRAAAHLVLRRG